MAAFTPLDPPPDPPWYEASPGVTLKKAFELLEGTFPHRYLHYDVAALQKKLARTRKYPPEDSGAIEISSLRAFTWNDTEPRIAALFFLRLVDDSSMAYSLSVGIDYQVVKDAGDLCTALAEICKYMQQHPDVGVNTIDVINQRMIGDKSPSNPHFDDLGDTDASKLLKEAFELAATNNQLSYFGQISPPPPWPNRLQRWQIEPLP